MKETRDVLQPSGHVPDAFDQAVSNMSLPDVVRTKPTTLRTMNVLGMGATMWIIQSCRKRDGKETTDTIFLESVSQHGTIRLVIPGAVANVIARQRDALTTKTRSRAAKARAEENKAAGILPGFLRPRPKSRKRAAKAPLDILTQTT